MTDYSKPHPVSDVQQAFPANLGTLLPAWSEIPEEFRRDRTPWNDFASRAFFGFKQRYKISTPRDGVDIQAAYRHIRTLLGSYEPKHEHKEAAVAWLLSLWFETIEPEYA